MSGTRSRRWERGRFELRLLMTLVLTLAVIGTFAYFASSRDAQLRLIDDATARAQADVVFVQQAFASRDDDAERVREMGSRLKAINEREGIVHALLIDRYGVVVAASDPDMIGTFHGGPLLRRVADSGRASSMLFESDGARYFRYLVPVDLPTGRFAMEVEQEASILEERLAELRHSILRFIAIGVVVGILLFFALGGRRLAEMHTRALRASSRDGLTNLENHRSFQEALERTVAIARRQGTPLTLALIDLDDFKMINDRLGHRQGDQVLRRVAGLLETGRLGDRSFRIGGDEFALLLPEADQHAGWVVCERLWQSFAAELDGATVSVGLASLTAEMNAADLQEQADVALYEAKRRGRNTLVSFEELEGAAVIPADKVRAVRELLAAGEMGTAFQPIWDLQSQRPLGFEALARPPKSYGLQGPAELFSIGETIGRSTELDALSWRCALERASSLPADTLLFLNVSPFTADHGDGPVDLLCDVVAQSGLAPAQIVVEFTEKWSGRRDLVIEQAERLRERGFRLALDDVGAGSGDLEMLARLPVDFVKIDLHVVRNARTDRAARGVLFAITAFARHSGSFVIAEGIEDAATLEFLRGGVAASEPRDVIAGGQGYFLGMPLEIAPGAQQTDYPSLLSEAQASMGPTSLGQAKLGQEEARA